MTYNPKQECTTRSQRRTKRTLPKKKYPTSMRVHPKPKNHNKTVKIKARRDQHIKDAIDYAADVEEHDYERLAPRIVTYYILENGTILPKKWKNSSKKWKWDARGWRIQSCR